MYLPNALFTILPLLLPYLLGLIVWEWWQYRRSGKAYPWADALISIGVAVVRRTSLQLGAAGLAIGVLRWIHGYHWSDFPVSLHSPREIFNGVLLVFGADFLYYCQHRTMHQVRWFWADHSVHHTPNRLVFVTAGRLGWFTPFTGALLFYAPLTLLGFAPEVVIMMIALNLVYQFWLHTELIPKLGWFELIFNTPSHHRVHHGANARYLDANYGGIFIVWDRLFGTFVEEAAEEPVRFGLPQPQLSRNPAVVALHEWRSIVVDVARNWQHPVRALNYLFNVPGWSHDGSRQTTAMIRSNAASNPVV